MFEDQKICLGHKVRVYSFTYNIIPIVNSLNLVVVWKHH